MPKIKISIEKPFCNTRETVFITFPNTKNRVENMMCSGVFMMNFGMFGNVIKYSLKCLIYLFNQNQN